jgi:hypothetical protein
VSTILRRGSRASDNFTSITNDALRDSRLTFKARGILAYLMSHSDGWEINVSAIARAGGCGRDAVMSGLKELREAGYLHMTQVHDEGGRMAKWEYEITDAPQSENPTADHGRVFPQSDNPESDNPTAKEEHPYKKKISQEKNLSSPDGEGELDALFDHAWSSWPRGRGSRKDARAKFMRLTSRGGAFHGNPEALAHAIAEFGQAYLAAKRTTDESIRFTPHLTTWLNREGWNETPQPPYAPPSDERSDANQRMAGAFVAAVNILGDPPSSPAIPMKGLSQ